MIYLGTYGSAASREEYNRLISEWLAAGRKLPVDLSAITVNEVVAAFRQHAKRYYTSANGKVSTEVENYDQAVKPLVKLYGRTPAAEFGPLRLKVLREAMIANGHVRSNINKLISRIKGVFKWATSQELLSPSVYHSLLSVGGLKHGRSEAAESEPVKAVDDAIVGATLPHLSSVVRAMVRIQRLTGARPGEICAMRVGDIDRSGPVWQYRPRGHKTAHFGYERIIFIGPKAQDVFAPFLLKLNPDAFVFNPQAATAEMRQRRADARKTPISCGNIAGENVEGKPRRQPGDCYTADSYRRAIARAADAADLWAKGGVVINDDERLVPRWHPHQLRHSAATAIRKDFGIEGAQHVLGHKVARITEIYAEKNNAMAERIAAAVG